MSWLASPPVSAVFRRSEATDINEGRLRRLVDSGELIRIAPGSFVWPRDWDKLGALERHAQKVWEAAARVQPGTVFCHAAASAVQSLDLLGAWPDKIDISVDDRGGGRSTGLIRRHSRRFPVDDLIPWGEHFLTTPARTALDLAATRPFAEGVASIDQALWERREGGALLSSDGLWDAVDRFHARGQVRAARAAHFADARAANVRESQSRVIIDQLGFPAPVLQQRFDLPSGEVAFTDFWWPDYGVGGELDGVAKYLNPRYRKGRSPAQVLIDEKDREDELRRLIRTLARWRVPALDSPAMLWDILVAAGLPTSRRRPAR